MSDIGQLAAQKCNSPRKGKQKREPQDCPGLLPWGSFQATEQGEGTQMKLHRLAELGRQRQTFKEAKVLDFVRHYTKLKEVGQRQGSRNLQRLSRSLTSSSLQICEMKFQGTREKYTGQQQKSRITHWGEVVFYLPELRHFVHKIL